MFDVKETYLFAKMNVSVSIDVDILDIK
jgi:hypothetical protein